MSTNPTRYAYEFGRAVAQWERQNLDLEFVLKLFHEAGGSGAQDEQAAMIGAFDEFKRIMSIYYPSAE